MPSPMDRYYQGYQFGESLMQGRRREEYQDWQRGMREKEFGVQEDYLDIALEKLKMLQEQPPESPYGRPPWWTEGLTPEQIGQYQRKQVTDLRGLTKLTLPSDWLKAPAKRESAVQKWVTDWEKYIFTSRTKLGETGAFEDLNEAEKRTHFNKWVNRVPPQLRMKVRQQVGMAVPTGKAPISEPSMEIQKRKIDAGLKTGATVQEIRDAIEREKERLIRDGVDIEELYRYLGL